MVASTPTGSSPAGSSPTPAVAPATSGDTGGERPALRITCLRDRRRAGERLEAIAGRTEGGRMREEEARVAAI
ncbi:histidinol dehydrogenase, partial [Synechococcus sp. BA-120 BA3]|nr:histidinol dehydrogenase [Synechococcus sp. BA-120 BA3]